jgi:hypothetical protein
MYDQLFSNDRPTFVHGVVALFERSADELFIVRHTADFLLVFVRHNSVL